MYEYFNDGTVRFHTNRYGIYIEERLCQKCKEWFGPDRRGVVNCKDCRAKGQGGRAEYQREYRARKRAENPKPDYDAIAEAVTEAHRGGPPMSLPDVRLACGQPVPHLPAFLERLGWEVVRVKEMGISFRRWKPPATHNEPW